MMHAFASRSFAALSAVLMTFAIVRTARAEEAAVHVDGDPSTHLELLDRTDQSTTVYVGRYGTPKREWVYRTVCDRLPCDAQLTIGEHHLALAKPGGVAIEADQIIAVNGPMNLTGDYEDRSLVRAAGWLALLGGAVGGTALVVTAKQDANGRLDPEQAGAGIAVLVAGALVSLPLVLQQDGASFSMQPISVGDAKHAPGGGLFPNGLALTMRF